jgi:hypothetical protein
MEVAGSSVILATHSITSQMITGYGAVQSGYDLP